MSLILPESIGSATGWTLADYRTLTLTTGPAAAGSARGAGPQLDLDELWLVDHMVAVCDSTTDTRLRVYETAEAPGFLLDGTGSGNFDVADWPNGLQVQPGRQLLAVWTGASNAAVGTLNLQLRVLRRAG